VLVPVLVIAKPCDFVWPSTTLPKLKLAGETLNPACVPVPLKATEVGEVTALLAMLTVPFRVPAVVGANTAVNVAVPPTPTVAGSAKPLTLNPAPLAVICEIVKVLVPLLVMVNACDAVWPLATLPKLKLAGETPNPACAPVPFSTMVAGELAASLTTESDPLALPATVGANTAFKLTLAAGLTDTGNVKPFALNPAPVAVTPEIFTVAVPLLVNTIACEALLPVATFPKL